MPMVALGSATSIYRKGRKFIFGMSPPGEIWLEGLIELAAMKGLKTVTVINPDDPFGRPVAQGTSELAKKKGLHAVFAGAYPPGSTDFSTILTKVRAANPDVLAGASGVGEDAMALVRQLKALR